MPTHVLYGDSFLVRQALKCLEVDADPQELLEANRHNIQASQVKPADLMTMCYALPFMDTYRLVVVEGLLSTLERRTGERRTGERRTGRSRAGDARSPAPAVGLWEELTRTVPEMPDTTVLVFVDGQLADGNPLLRMLRPLAQVQSLPAPAGEALARWTKDAAQKKGSSITPPAIKYLTDLVGSDLWTLDRELEKLSLYASGRSIEESDVAELVSRVREGNIFAAVDAMIDGRPGVALRLLHQVRQDGQDAPYIIAMVERQLRLLALVRDSMDKGVPSKDLGSHLGITSQFVLRKTVQQARRHSWEDIRSRYHRLLEADLAVKRGRLNPDLALELLVADQAAAERH